MKYIVIRWLITAIALVVAAYLVPGIRVEGDGVVVVLATAAILGLVNAVLRPILAILSCGCIVLTLGLFILVINAFTFWLASQMAQSLNLGFQVDGFWPALWGSILVSIVSFLLSVFVKDDRAERSVIIIRG